MRAQSKRLMDVKVYRITKLYRKKVAVDFYKRIDNT